MKRNHIRKALWSIHAHINKSVKNISRKNNEVNWSKEEMLIARLETKLGRPKEEITKLVSKDLLSLLSMVPFSEGK
ncbi:MAG: hypothetical protein K2X86_16655 [Cytophagaceae bacterium]|nr:hypothetical protein [Cytophagaceae bacterium]